MTFHALQDAYRELMKNCTHIVNDRAPMQIAFPEELWKQFEQEYALCFIEPEDDFMFNEWQEPYEEDENEG